MSNPLYLSSLRIPCMRVFECATFSCRTLVGEEFILAFYQCQNTRQDGCVPLKVCCIYTSPGIWGRQQHGPCGSLRTSEDGCTVWMPRSWCSPCNVCSGLIQCVFRCICSTWPGPGMLPQSDPASSIWYTGVNGACLPIVWLRPGSQT
jgi:hypothetical protein